MSKDYSYTSVPFLNEIMTLSSDITWKNRSKALEGEADTDSIEVDQYLAAKKGLLTFDSIYMFSEDVLEYMGFTETQVINIVDDKYEIPEAQRNTATKLQIQYIIDNYEEMNNYYRMLYGLPDTDDEDYFYNTEYPDISDSTTPIHKMTLQQRFALENTGYITSLLKANPTKKYLRHIALRNITPYESREAQRFQILYIGTSNFVNLQRDFVDVYNEVTAAIDDTFYNDAMRKNNSEYEGFIAMCILFMTIQKMFTKYLECDLTREFYDVESLRLIYDSYGVPFYASIPIEYHRKIVKNINQLLSNKGSTKVLYQLFDIFDFGMIDIFEYYILKIHKFDGGKPVFIYKQDGSLDLKKMYEIKFGKVKLYNDPPMELSQVDNHIDYNGFISTDPYWINDDELLNKLYSEEYNYLESKYLGIQTVFNLMKIMYESTFYFNAIINNRQALENSTIYMSSIGDDVNIFHIVIYLASLVCRKHGYTGLISSKLSTISKVRGFDFVDSINKILSDIQSNKYLNTDTTLHSYLSAITIKSVDTLNSSYNNIVSLRNYLGKVISDTHDPDVYIAYRDLYDNLMYSEYVDKVFAKADGTTAASFEDLLADLNGDLYTRLLSNIDYASEISAMLVLFKKSCTSLGQIQFADGASIASTLEYLFKIMDFFKSAKSDLTGYSIIYTLNSNTNNILKLLSKLELQSFTQEPFLDELSEMSDEINVLDLKFLIDNEDTIQFDDRCVNNGDKYFVDDELPLSIVLKSLVTKYTEPIVSDMSLSDTTRIASESKQLKGSSFGFTDVLTLISESTED